MASSKRKKHGAGYVVLIAVLILVLLAVVAAVTGYSLVARRVKALQAGAAFTFDYEITSTADSPALYTILQKTGSTKGTVNGLYAPDALQLSISAPDAVIPAGGFWVGLARAGSPACCLPWWFPSRSYTRW